MMISNEDEDFLKRINSLVNKAIINNNISILKFLDIHKQEIVKYACGKKVYLYFDGGYSDCEYKKAMISSFEIKNPNLKISILKLNYNPKYLTLNHRKVLACLLDLGIKREVIGDIVFNDTDCYIMVSEEIKEYVIDNLRNISHTPVELTEYFGEVIKKINYETKKVFVTSLRVDSVIASMYGISRNKAQEMVRGDLVKVNEAKILNVNHVLKENDMISVRGKGRFYLGNILGSSRSERIIVELKKVL